MSAITPQTELRLLKCPIEEDNRNQLTFANETAQFTYFNSLPSIDCENFTYQRKDSIIRFPDHIDNIIGYNYVMYKNEAYTDKWFYGFITNMEYVNDHMTYITIKTDVFQTWQFDIVYKKSFIEREHVNDDSLGKNTIPENLETGDVISQSVVTKNYGTFYPCIAVSEDILRSDQTIYHHNYNGVVSGLTFIALKTSADVNYFIFRYNQSSKIDAINSIFMIPDSYLPTGNWSTDSTGLINYKYITEQDTPFDLGSQDITKPTILGEGTTGYTPKNNKLFTFPYCYILADNNAGTNVIYRYEDFETPTGATAGTCRFKCIGTINTGCSIKFIPINYKNISENYNESFNGAKLPLGGWINDVYTNWLRQNGVNIAINLAGSALQIIGGIGLSGTGAGSVAGGGQIASGITGVANTLGQIYQHSLIPNQAEGNVNSSDIMFSAGKIGCSIYKMSLKIEYLKIIDQFFSTYGYKVNQVKLPNVTGRTNWNYVKTIDCNLEGDIPEKDIQELKDIFNKGITFWHNPTTYLDYSVTNAIV